MAERQPAETLGRGRQRASLPEGDPALVARILADVLSITPMGAPASVPAFAVRPVAELGRKVGSQRAFQMLESAARRAQNMARLRQKRRESDKGLFDSIVALGLFQGKMGDPRGGRISRFLRERPLTPFEQRSIARHLMRRGGTAPGGTDEPLSIIEETMEDAVRRHFTR